nr:hypothetical protein MFLOJ_43600 [Mycobacterium florentinum]
MNTTQSTPITTATLAGCTPRLLIEQGPEDLAAYRRLGGYLPLADAEALLSEVEASGLVGRGGAAFPLAVKLRTVRDNGRLITGGPVVIANGEEGEPASLKDRWLLRNRPHLVLDGLRLAAAVVAADRAYVYVSDPESAHSVETALGELDSEIQGISVQVITVAPGYVAGEETAAVRMINGGPAKPTDKPPRPFEAGVDDRPTLVSNVETLANLPYLQGHGSAEFRSQGTSLSPGTFLATITGGGRPPVLYELPHGLAFTELLALHGISPEKVRGALMGGYFAGLLNRTVLETSLDHETMRRLGSGLGCGAVSVITDDCPIAVAAGCWPTSTAKMPGSAGRASTGRRRWRRRPGRCATAPRRKRTSTGCAVGRCCCAGAGPARHWMPPPISPPACSINSRPKSPHISTAPARTAPVARSAPTDRMRQKL